MRHHSRVSCGLVFVLALQAIACSAPAPTSAPTDHDATIAWYAAQTDALRQRIAVLRGSLGAALDSLPADRAPYRVAVEGRALMRVADSLALLSAQERTLCLAAP
ncbi:hypothetical protein [Gemmatimonas sp.]